MDEEVIEETNVELVKDEVKVVEKKKPKKEKKIKKSKLDLTVSCTRIRSKNIFDFEITRTNLATFSHWRKKGTVIKIKGMTGKYVAQISEEQYAEIIKIYK